MSRFTEMSFRGVRRSLLFFYFERRAASLVGRTRFRRQTFFNSAARQTWLDGLVLDARFITTIYDSLFCFVAAESFLS